MANLIPIPIFIILVMLQLAIFGNLPLLQGTADIVMLALIAWTMQKGTKYAYIYGFAIGTFVGLISAIPVFIYIGTYTMVVFLARYLQQRIWQMPILAMLALTVLGTFICHLVSILYLQISQIPISFADSFLLVTLPSLLFNIILAVPIYLFAVDLANWLHPNMENE
ncbi:MAG: hypothetical protein JEZ06_11525 [Anaerolineaceae bacterium]|nr:hypothetical protein [Anaerolineaceae bacterium]